MTEVKGSHTYQAAVADVIAMLADSQATVEKYEELGNREVKVVECRHDGPTLRVTSTRIVDVDLPSFAKRVLKPTNSMTQTDEWHEAADGGWDGTFDVEVKGAPVHISGTARLTPSDGSCRHDVTILVTVKVPLVGGKIADWAAKNDVQRTLDGEFDFGDRWLAARRG